MSSLKSNDTQTSAWNLDWLNFKSQPYLTDTGDSSNSTEKQSSDNELTKVIVELVKFGISIALTYYFTAKVIRILTNVLESPEDKIKQKEDKKQLAKRLNRPDIEFMSFNTYEGRFLNLVVSANEINVSFDDIGGMDIELEDVKDNIILPIKIWNRFKSYKGLSSCPSGILLYGKPGTGKSLTAKAIAKGKILYYIIYT